MENVEYKQKSRLVSVRFGLGEVDFLAQMAEQFGFSIGQAVRECVLLKIKASAENMSDAENVKLSELTDLIKQGFEIVIGKLDSGNAVQYAENRV